MKNIKKIASIGLCALALVACGNGGNQKVGEATAEGYNGDIKVKVTLNKDGAIEKIETEHDETPEVGGQAIDELTKEIIKANGTEGVDSVSDATVSSDNFKKAVDEAVKNAQ